MERERAGPSGHISEETAHAWLDGALSRDEAARVEGHVQGCDACAEVVARARGMIAAASRILGALDEVPVVVPARARRRASWVGWTVRVAAAVVVVAGVTWRMQIGRPPVGRAAFAAAPAAARAQCYDVVAPATGAVAKRIVLDTGHAALVNAKAGQWTAPAPDSVVVYGDRVKVQGRITSDGMTGAASAANAEPQAFTAKKCERPK